MFTTTSEDPNHNGMEAENEVGEQIAMPELEAALSGDEEVKGEASMKECKTE